MSTVAAFVIALVPAAFALWWGRQLARLIDDPALPERLVANRSRNAMVAGCAMVFLIWIAPLHTVWSLPLLFVARLAAAYPLRRVLHQETWNLGAYLSFFVRLIVAFTGFWLVLALVPSITTAMGSWQWPAAVAVILALVLWNHHYGRVFRFMMRARPFEHPQFARMVEQCGLRNVALEEVKLGGGTYANAVALPSLRRRAVVVSETLVTRFDSDELASVLAHELAHHEHYNDARLRQLYAIGVGLILVGGLIGPASATWSHAAKQAVMFMWPVVLLISLMLRARSAQKNETASDLRAISLTGNPDALIRALTKLHAFAHMPRRWDTDVERQSSHPSLARRIQAIREAAGAAPAALGEAAVFPGADGIASVTFHDDRLAWSENPQASHTFAYGVLTELRIEAAAAGSATLIVKDSGTRRWRMKLHDADVARAQATLDIVDSRLGTQTTAARGFGQFTRSFAGLAVLMALALTQFAAALVGALALLWPITSMAAAAGSAAVAAAALVWRDAPVGDARLWMIVSLVIIGGGLIGVAFTTRHEPKKPVASALVTVLGVCALTLWAAAGLWGFDVLRIHRGMSAWPGVAVFTVAVAAACAFDRTRWLRYVSMPMAIGGLFAGFASSASFVDRFGSDPFLAAAPPITWRTIDQAPLNTQTVSLDVTELRLSPHATSWALYTENDEEEITIHTGRVGGPLKGFNADQALFVDESTLLLLDTRDSGSELRLVTLEETAHHSGWSLQLPIEWGRLSFDRHARTWHALGRSEDDEIVSVTGKLSGDHVQERRWPSPADVDGVRPVAITDAGVLAIETQVSERFVGDTISAGILTPFEAQPRIDYRLWSLTGSAADVITATQLSISCMPTQVDDSRTLCVAPDLGRTRFFAIDPGTRRPEPLASVGGLVFIRGDAGNGWLAGWWDGHAVLFHPAKREGLMLGAQQERVYQLTAADTVVGAVSNRGDQSIVSLYQMDDGEGR